MSPKAHSGTPTFLARSPSSPCLETESCHAFAASLSYEYGLVFLAWEAEIGVWPWAQYPFAINSTTKLTALLSTIKTRTATATFILSPSALGNPE